MCNNCDPVGQALSTIARHGWSITAVGGEGHEYPAFAYTSGLTARGCPELLCYGLPPHTSGRIINGLAERLVAGMRVDPGARVSEVLGNGLDVALVEVVDPSDMLVTGALYTEFSAIQIVWPDADGRFPWEAGYSMCSHHQPLKGVGWV